MKKRLALILSVAMLVGVLSACSEEAAPEESAVPVESTEPTESTMPEVELMTQERDYDAIRDSYPLDAVVMTINGSEVTWEEYFYWMYSAILDTELYVGPITDMTAMSAYNPALTNAEHVVEMASANALQYHTIKTSAEEQGIVLDAEDEEKLAETLQIDIELTSGEGATEEQFFEDLAEVYISPALYDHIMSISYMYTKIFDETYGENGEKLSDEAYTSFVEENGYMTARHILFYTLDNEGAAMSEEDAAAVHANAIAVADALQAETDPAAREALFNEYYAQYNEDHAQDMYPGGYCFPTGMMVPEFEAATAALGEYEVSEPIESAYGYHVIYRMPTTPEDIVEFYSETDYATLGYVAAVTEYSEAFAQWADESEIVWTTSFEEIDFGALLNTVVE